MASQIGVVFLDLRGLLKVQFEISYKRFQQSQLKRACMVNYIYVNDQAKFIETRLILQINQS